MLQEKKPAGCKLYGDHIYVMREKANRLQTIYKPSIVYEGKSQQAATQAVICYQEHQEGMKQWLR